ncbi:MAG: hypothetical protein ABSB53_00520 [Nitrososphaerales archaeon]|jgi:metal-responsive CopG/Arc/MetJ family transcriptional regulator
MNKRKDRVQVTLPTGVLSVVDQLTDDMGDNRSEVVRNIVISYLSDKDLIPRKERGKGAPSAAEKSHD